MSPASKARQPRTASARPTRRAATADDDAEHALAEIVAAMAEAEMAKPGHAADASRQRSQPTPAKKRQQNTTGF